MLGAKVSQYNTLMNKQNSAARIDKITTWLDTGSLNIFGRPYAGKDTQARHLAELFNAPIIGGGDILRNTKKIPDHVRKIMHLGELIPIQDYLDIMIPYLSQSTFTGMPLILSSVGRRHGEEQGILQATSSAGHPLKGVVYIDLDELAVRDRWQISQDMADRGQRADDAAEILQTRLNEFRSKTLPVVSFYRDIGLLIEVDGHAPPSQVTSEIINKLSDHAKLDQQA